MPNRHVPLRGSLYIASLTAACAWLLAPPLGAVPSAPIKAIVSRVQATNATADVDSYGDFLKLLAVNEGDRRGYWTDRTPQDDLAKARTAIRTALIRSLGSAQVTNQRFTAGGYAGINVVGVLPGVGAAPQQQFVIGAHYDSVENPGADDDASGVAGMLEAARVLRGYRFTGTIVFVAFDQEEQRANGWGKGSQYYASRARSSRANLKGMVGLDMMAYNHGGGNRATISRCDFGSGTPGEQLSNRVRTAFLDYSGLAITQLKGEKASDPYRFFTAGYAAVLVSEQFNSRGWPLNPYYHKNDDFFLGLDGQPNRSGGRQYIDLTYAAKIVRGVVGWVATEAGYVGARTAQVRVPEPAAW